MSDIEDIMNLLHPDPWEIAEIQANREDVEEDPYDGKFSRANLKVERLYHEQPTGMYFYTPDGVGCIWYDTLEEAMADTDAFGQPIITLCQELSDF